MLDKFFSHHKNRRVAVALALLGTVTPIAGLHKLYLGQPVWGLIYILLWSTPISRIAAAVAQVEKEEAHRLDCCLEPVATILRGEELIMVVLAFRLQHFL